MSAPLATYTSAELQRELLIRSIERRSAEITRLSAVLESLANKQRSCTQELLRLDRHIAAKGGAS